MNSALLPRGQAPLHILLVDDDPDCRLLLRDALESCQPAPQISEVSNGLEAMDYLQRRGEFSAANQPDLMYLDLEMPGMNGQEVLRAIRALEEFKELPVVMMTGVSDEGQMRMAARNGANSYTLKPADAQAFLSTVQASAYYWLSVHQIPGHQPPVCRV